MIGNRPPVITAPSVPRIQVDGAGDEPGATKADTEAALRASIQRAGALSGIPESHMALLQRIAVEHKSIIAIRPVDRHNTALILAGYPTKGLQIKGKSANWGPQYGFICVDQRFSKLRGRDPEKVRKANESVQGCLQDGHAESIDLHLTPTRLNYLIHEGLLVKQGNGGRFHLRAQPAQPDDPEFAAERLANGDFRILADKQPLQVLAPPLLEGATGKGITQQPLTADYDLLAVMPEWSQFSSQNIRRPSSPTPSEGLSPVVRAATLPTWRPGSFSETAQGGERRRSTTSGLSPAASPLASLDEEDGIPPLNLSPFPQRPPSVTNLARLFEQQASAVAAPGSRPPSPAPGSRRDTLPASLELPTLLRKNSVSSLISRHESLPLSPSAVSGGPVDNVSEHEKRIADSINSQLRENTNSSEKTGYESAWQLVHHGSDEGNPASDEADNYPATVFLPHDIGSFEAVTVLERREDLARLVKTATDAGYHFEGNKHWPMARQEGQVARRLSELERRLSISSVSSTEGGNPGAE